MEIYQLELFLAVLQHGTVTRAAAEMNLSPGAVSLQLHNLAAELRANLFVRSGKHLHPTPDAFRLAEHAKAVLRQVRQIHQEFQNDPDEDRRPFHFATGATTLIHRLGRPLRMLRKRYPSTPIRVTVASTEVMVAGLRDRRFDLALITLPYPEGNLSLMPLFEEELLLLRPSATVVRGWHVGTIEPRELEGAPFLLYPVHSNMRAIIESFFRGIEVTPNVIMEADDTEAIKRLVESGFGYSMLPEIALRKQPRYFQVFRVANRRVVRHQALAMVRTEYPRALTLSVAKFLHATLTSACNRTVTAP